MNSLYQSLITAFFILLTALCFYLNRILVDKRKLQRTNALLKRLYSSNLVYAQLERQIHTLKSVIEDYPCIPEPENDYYNNRNNNCFGNNAHAKTAETPIKPTKNVNEMSFIDDGVELATFREACEMLVTGEVILEQLEKQRQAARVDLLKDGVYTERSQ
ncbi:9_t:CDS:2 [Paraglomus occultum]|uniref:9_t:CDS:1 n=1 Tax=Paraglomus occultum TaxID=144539 RepID=A0A9N9CIT1_9GLOM|nr:9_t:CDS:2 [Paraglomus occultum]